MTRVLVVEDDPQLVRALIINLQARRYGVDAAPDGATALRLAAARQPDVVLLDLGLPDMDGVEVIKALRAWTRVPIMVLSARQASEEKVAALDVGADDYITKPFSMDELLARLRAAVRRTEDTVLAPRIGRIDAADASWTFMLFLNATTTAVMACTGVARARPTTNPASSRSGIDPE
ncbi:Response regulator receiver domain-containing protein [Streptomyces sp. 1222.2]|uniref:Two-component system KDP operon response regulator KdpE n=1 Tax=Streptomyces stelliscabiei TaxID=146820 RepID=A0A8I0TXC7_9ACTN|nr:two-component system KDP operon response regulator KdpE [Streptomyces stelliscabiei]SOD65319.1 Response regulator receiver domain-containing protein [Streptomyces sp. 1222.2]